MNMDTFESGRSPVTPQNLVERDIWETTFRVRGISGVRVERAGTGWQVVDHDGHALKVFGTLDAAFTWLESFGFSLLGAHFDR